MSSIIKSFEDRIFQLKPSELLDPSTANDLYNSVPTPARSYEGLAMMPTKESPNPYITFTAQEPTKGLIHSVIPGTRSPVRAKKQIKTERQVVVKFKDSYIFTEDDLHIIKQAQNSNQADGVVRLAAERIVSHIEDLKFRNLYTKEALFWQGLYSGTMNVPQEANGVTSNYQISTGTRSLAALTSTTVWNYWYTTSITNSTANPVADLRAMGRTFTGKGAALKIVYMNRKTFDMLVDNPAFFDKFKYVSTTYVTEYVMETTIGGITLRVYNEGYLDDSGTFTNFIPDGYIVGIGYSDSMNGKPFMNVKTLNVDADDGNKGTSVNAVYGEYFRINTLMDPVSKQLYLSDYGLPVITNGQMIVSQKVF
jgi:hypothetical protein